MAIETVTSSLLSDPPADPKPQAQPVSQDFADTVAAGYVETADVWITRTGKARAALVNVDPASPDAEAKRAELRREVCVARGVDPKDICPVMGYDLSADAFRRARDGWVEHLKARRASDWTYNEHDRARAFWAKARPNLIHEWPEVVR